MMPDIMTFGIGLGSNLGDRLTHIRAGVAFLQTLMKSGLRVSSLYETSPVGCAQGTRSFYNAVAEGEFDGSALELFGLLKEFEKSRGERDTSLKNAPRALDLDLLYCDKTVANPELTLPHPRLFGRRFVLKPLCEIHPELRISGQEKSVKELLIKLESDEIIKKIGSIL